MSQQKQIISVRGARVNNLKNVSVDIPKNQLVVMTGLSGSGKSSLAFDTIYAEGQRRYMESLSSYARQFLEMNERPDVDEITGLSPTIAIDQRSASHNPRSTVGTVTEIYDYLRVLYARAGEPHCPSCGEIVRQQTMGEMMETLRSFVQEQDTIVFAPLVQSQRGEHTYILTVASQAGFSRVRFDGMALDIAEAISMRKDKKKPHSIDIEIKQFSRGSIISDVESKECIRKALDYGNGVFYLFAEGQSNEQMISEGLHCPVCHINLPPLEPRLFSFNTPQGACPECTGLGIKLVFEPDLVIPNKRLTIAEGAIRPLSRIAGNHGAYLRLWEAVAKKQRFSLHTPLAEFSKEKMHVLFYGTGETEYSLDGQPVLFPGIIHQLEEKYRASDSEYVHHELEGYMRTRMCPACEGKRLRPELLSVTFQGKNIADVCLLSIADLRQFFLEHEKPTPLSKKKIGLEKTSGSMKKETVQQTIIERMAKEIRYRLDHLCQVGLEYLTLDRSTITLSGGEVQHVRLATQLGNSLSGIIYVLDEPSIGLHPKDTQSLIDTMKELRDLGNTVLVVEHDRAIIEAADYLIDVGPGAGVYGGEIIAEGTVEDIKRKKESITGAYLSGRSTISPPKKHRAGNTKKLTIHEAQAFNLKHVTVSIPLGMMVCVTGVSGSGKSTLILDILGNALSQHFYRAKTEPAAHDRITGTEALDKVVVVDQSPIGCTPRSNPATYTGLFTLIRDLFADLPEAKMRQFDAGKFSFNVKGGGRCEVCAGEGMRHIEMQFMPDVYMECPECQGSRYQSDVLDIHYHGKNIAHVLAMTVEEARRFFADRPLLYDKLQTLYEVGLGYLRLGQSATTLSGGEAQRVKLATELARRSTGRTLYILDEPTTGLHFQDIHRLLGVLQQLVDKGNTVLVIEHNMDVIKGADWVIDMGPGGGEKGGTVVFEGRPEGLKTCKESVTGKYLD